MFLIPAKCTQCGANLKVDPTKEAAICSFCGTPFITQKAINNYNTTNVTNIGNLHADVVQVYDENSIDSRIKSGNTFLKLKDFDSAEMVFRKLVEECPYEYRGWFGLVEAYTRCYTVYYYDKEWCDNIKTLFQNGLKVAENDNRVELQKAEFEKYIANTEKKIADVKSVKQKQFDELKSEYEKSKAEYNEKYADCKKREKLCFMFGNPYICAAVVAFFVIVPTILPFIIDALNDGNLIYSFETFFTVPFKYFLCASPIWIICIIVTVFFYNRAGHYISKRWKLESDFKAITEKYQENIYPLKELLSKL